MPSDRKISNAVVLVLLICAFRITIHLTISKVTHLRTIKHVQKILNHFFVICFTITLFPTMQSTKFERTLYLSRVPLTTFMVYFRQFLRPYISYDLKTALLSRYVLAMSH